MQGNKRLGEWDWATTAVVAWSHYVLLLKTVQHNPTNNCGNIIGVDSCTTSYNSWVWGFTDTIIYSYIHTSLATVHQAYFHVIRATTSACYVMTGPLPKPLYPCSDSDGKESPCNAGDLGLIPRSGRSPGEGNGYPLQYSCLENSTDRGVWQATVQGVAKSQTRLSD